MKQRATKAVLAVRWGIALTAWLVASAATPAAAAVTSIWNGGDGNWSNAANWSAGIPGSSDTASFTSSTVTCNIATSQTVAAITITKGVTINLNSGANLTVSGTFSQSAGIFNGGTGTIQIGGDLALSGGTFSSTSGLMKIVGAFNKSGGTFSGGTGRVMLASVLSQNLTLTGTTTFNNIYVNDGLVGYWKLDDSSSTVTDSSGYGNDGSRSASGTTWQSAVPATMDFTDSGSILLNGSAGYVTLGASNLPATNAAQTISLWAKPTNTTQNGDMASLSAGSSTGLQVKINAGILQVTSWGGASLISTTAPSAGNWHHIAYTYDGASHQTLYVDGTATTATATNQTGAATVAYLGTYNAGGELFNGSLDEVRVYNRALSATEIGNMASGYQPATSLATQTMSAGATISGDLVIASGTLAAGGNNLSVGGNWWNYGVFSGTGTVTFNGGSGTVASILTNGQMPGSLTIGGAGSWTVVDGSSINLKLTGSYSQTLGTFTSSAGLLNIAGSFNKTGGTFNGGGGQVMLTAPSGTQTFSTTGTTSFTNLTINDGLAGYWPLDDSTGSTTAADASGYGNTGTFTSPAWLTSSLPNTKFTDTSAGSFNGSSSFVDISTPVTPTNAAYSACAWVYMTSNTGFRTFVSIDGTTDSAFYLQKRADTTKFALTMLASDADAATAFHADGTTVPAANTWYHVCGTYDATNMKIYVNGALEGTTAMSSPWKGTGHTIIGAGKFTGNHTDWVAGYIDDVRVYSRALSATEVSALGSGYEPGTYSATQSLTGSFSVSGNLTLASGFLAMGANTISLSGNWWDYGGALSATYWGGAAINLAGTATTNTILSGGQFLPSLNLTGTGKWTLADNLDVDPNATVTMTTGSLDVSSRTIRTGTLASGSGTLTTTGATVILDGNSNRTFSVTPQNVLRIEDPSETNLVGYWKFDETQGSSARDWTGAGHTATLVNAATWGTSVPSKVEFYDPAALKLASASSQYADAGASASWLPTNAPFSACGWVNYTSLNIFNAVLSFNGASVAVFTVQRDNAGQFSLDMRSTDSTGATLYHVIGSTTVSTGTWYHVCGVFDGSKGHLYVNGTEEGTAATIASTWNASGHFTIGTNIYSGTLGDYTNGTIDDVRVYNVALTAAQVTQLANGRYANTGGTPTITLGGSVTASGVVHVDSGTFNPGAYSLNANGGMTVHNAGTLNLDTAGGTIALGSATTLTVDGTLKASSSSATIKSGGGASTYYTFTVGSTTTATPTLNISGLAVQNTNGGMAIGATTAALPVFTKFDNIAFSAGTGSQLLSIKSASLYLSSTGCSFDGGVTATTTNSVLLAGNGTADGETRVVFGGATCASGTTCDATKSDDDKLNAALASIPDGVGDNPGSNGAVIEFIRSYQDDTAGNIIGFPTAAFDWNTFTYYSTYVAFHNASGGASDVVYVRDETGNPLYSWTVPTSGETITGTPQWTTVSSKHYVFVATSAGKVYRLLDTATTGNSSSATLTLDTGPGAAWTTNPFICSCAITTPLAMDANNVYWGSTTSNKNFWTVGIASETNPTPVALTPVVTNAGLTIASVSNTTYAFMGVTNSILKISTAGNSLSDTNSSTGLGTINGRVVVGYSKTGTQRVFAGDDAGNFWALDPGSTFNTNGGVWKYPGGSGNAINGSPYYDHDTNTVQFGTQSGGIVVLNSSGGLFTGYPYTPAASDPITAAPLYYSGILVVGSTKGKLYFLDRNTGSGVSILKEYYFGPSESVSGIGYDVTVNRYMVTTANSSTLDGRVYYFDSVTDPTSSSL